MASFTVDDEDLAEASEVLYENANMLDNEPIYKNFAAIQNNRRRQDEQIQLKTSFQLNNTRKQIDRVDTESSYSNEFPTVNFDDLSEVIDDCIYNLTQIVEDIGYNPRSTFLQSSHSGSVSSTASNSPSPEPVTPLPQIPIHRQYFQNWYCNRYYRSAPMARYNPMNHIYQKATQKLEDCQSDMPIQSPVTTDVTAKRMDDEEGFHNGISRMYGFDDDEAEEEEEEEETVASECSRRSSIDRHDSPAPSDRFPTPIPLSPIEPAKPKQITIREYYPRNDLQSLTVNGSISPSSQRTFDENCYERVLHNHPDVCKDPDPEIIREPNPEEVVYKQKIMVRFLCPPTPPPPGPLIVREVLPPRAPSPPPLVIKKQQSAPPTPLPLILREEPPPPPLHQEATVITKVLPQEPPRPQRVIMEQAPTLPPKPQSIIIEKWLPYKPQPPREVIYERIADNQTISEFQAYDVPIIHERRTSKSVSRFPIPVHIERQRSFDHLGKERALSTFDQFARSTHRQLDALQQRTAQQIQNQQQWLVNQQCMNMCAPLPMPLMTPSLVINHAPITRTANVYAYRENFQQQLFCPQPYMYPAYM